MLDSFNFKKILLSKWIDYNRQIINSFFDRYILHHKIINRYKWYPVYTTMVPPMFSESSANLMWNSMFSSMFDKQNPFYVNIALTDKCNAKCSHCSFYWEDWIFDKNKKCLREDDFVKLVWDLQDMWTSMIWFVWWEPLMFEWLEKVLSSIDHKKTSTLLFTNWFILEDKIEMLYKNNLTSIAISIDHYDLEKHEEIRWLKWLWEKILKSIEKAKKYDFTLAMSTYISYENIYDLPKYIETAKKIWFHEIILFPTFPSWRLSSKTIYKDEEIFEYIRKTIKIYNEKEDYPWIYWYTYVSSRESLWCQWWKKYLYISPYWDVWHCDFYKRYYWNIKEDSIKNIFYKSLEENKNLSSCSIIKDKAKKVLSVDEVNKIKKTFNI